MTYAGWQLEADEVLALPVDELALAILADVAATNEWSAYNWMIAAQERAYGQRSNVLRALAEAWGWLRANGLVARDPVQSHGDAIFVTRLGRRVLDEGVALARAMRRLALDLHPTLERKVRRQFLMGEYELAAFAATRQVEIRVRELSGLATPGSVQVVRQAFREGGPLRPAGRDSGEQNALADLFAGAMGVFKNQANDQEVHFEDPTEAAEVVLLADLLLRS